MGTIKGWKKNTRNSWRNNVNSTIISIHHNKLANRYFVQIGIDIQGIRILKSGFKTKAQATKYAMGYMRGHPKG